jgi:hypothetical protein
MIAMHKRTGTLARLAALLAVAALAGFASPSVYGSCSQYWTHYCKGCSVVSVNKTTSCRQGGSMFCCLKTIHKDCDGDGKADCCDLGVWLGGTGDCSPNPCDL